VLIGATTVFIGLGVFVCGITRHDVDLLVLTAGLALFGIGSGCMLTPVSWAAVHTLDSSEVAHGSTLFNVNHNTAASIGAALMSVVLTSRLNAHDVAHAYTGVFLVAMILIAATAIPAWYLPTRAYLRASACQAKSATATQ
jgi:MFS transporter, DHA2 family, multidrug resistance protein